MIRAFRVSPRRALGLLALGAALTVGGALVAEHVYGLVPCKLCLLERRPYYAALPIALLACLLPVPPIGRRGALVLLALVFAIGAALGGYHSGAEWGWWPGPSDCGGGTGVGPAKVEDFLRSLDRTRPVSCTEAAWRFAGLSFAGWNALVSGALAAFAGWSALGRDPPVGPQGSSSVSQ